MVNSLLFAWYWLARFGCRVFCAVVFRFRAYGVENVPKRGAFILASNHQSYLDPIFCGVALRRHLSYVARDSLFRFKLFEWLIRSLNAIPIGRGKADLTAMRTIIARLKEGRGVCLYPEATRTPDGRIAPFKPGFGLLCRRAQAAVVPVLIDGSFECWPRHRKFFSAGRVTVCYGPALTPEEARAMTNEQLADHLTRTLRQMQHDYRRKLGKLPYDYGEGPTGQNS
jgi:1-acyl-sn-glycerol-3-phosphate acyltransferase